MRLIIYTMKKKINKKKRIRNKALLLYFTENELNLLKQKAKDSKIAASKYCRIVILRSLDRGLSQQKNETGLILDNLSSDTIELLRVNTGLLINIAKLINENKQEGEKRHD